MIRVINGCICAEYGGEGRGCPVGHPREAEVRAWYRQRLAEAAGADALDRDDAAASKGATPIGRVYRVATAAEALAVRAVLRPGDVVVRGTQLALIAGPQSDTVDGGIRQDEVTR